MVKWLWFVLIAASCAATQPENHIPAIVTAAGNGDPQAQVQLGRWYYSKRDYSKAATLWRQAAAHGVVPAYSNLGFTV